MKYRIKREGDYYIPQVKKLIFWIDIVNHTCLSRKDALEYSKCLDSRRDALEYIILHRSMEVSNKDIDYEYFSEEYIDQTLK